MKGLATKELLGIVDFIYYGQTNIFQEDINDFLAAAEVLQLKGLAHNITLENINFIDKDMEQFMKAVEQKRLTNSENKSSPEYVLSESIPIKQKNDYTYTPIEKTDKQLEGDPKRPNRLNSTLMSYNEIELDRTIDTMMERMNGFWRCNQCGKTAVLKGHIGSHIESHHRQGVIHNCRQCDYTCRTKHTLRVHMSRNHRQGKFTI